VFRPHFEFEVQRQLALVEVHLARFQLRIELSRLEALGKVSLAPRRYCSVATLFNRITIGKGEGGLLNNDYTSTPVMGLDTLGADKKTE
jgi:hypothetical protein